MLILVGVFLYGLFFWQHRCLSARLTACELRMLEASPLKPFSSNCLNLNQNSEFQNIITISEIFVFLQPNMFGYENHH